MEIKKGYKNTEVGVIPKDWRVYELGKLGTFKKGRNIPKSKIVDDGVLCVLYGEIYTTYNFYSRELISKTTIETAKTSVEIRNGDILFAGSGETAEDIGKCFTYIGDEIAYAGGDVIIFTSNNCNTLYLGFLLNSSNVIRQKSFMGQGSSVFHIYPNSLKRILIPLPPTLAEQTAIATALNDTDNLINQLEQLIAKKRAIKTGAMQELLSPTSSAQGKLKKGWVVKKLGEVADIIRGGSPRPIEAFLTKDINGINWIKIGDVDKSAKYVYSTEERIIEKGATYSRSVKEGDFLLSNSMSFGRPYILKTSGCVHDGWLVIQNYQSTFDRDFLYYILGFETTINQYKNLAAGSTVLNLNKEIVTKVSVSFPNLEEQTHIAQILSDMDTEIQALEKKIEKYKMIKQGMMQVLLTGKIRLV